MSIRRQPTFSKIGTRMQPTYTPSNQLCHTHDIALLEQRVNGIRVDLYCPMCRREELREIREG